MKIQQLITPSQPTFMVVDALGECTAVRGFRLFNLLKEIFERSPGVRTFVTGRLHICPEIETSLAGRATSISLGSNGDDIIGFLGVRLSEDETPDGIGSNPEGGVLEKISGSIGECG